MLLEEFDENRKAIFNPEDYAGERFQGKFPKTCVAFFQKHLIKSFVDKFNPERLLKIENATAVFPIYKVNYKGVEIAVCQVPVGAPACVGNLEEIIAMGCKNLVMVGTCGCLDHKIDEYAIIIPTAALRDEGTSYHYAKADDEVVLDVDCVEVVEEVMKDLGLSYHKGKTWTTDAIFRETKDKLEKRKKQGAIVVDMECSAVACLAKFRGVKFAQFFYAADNLGGDKHDIRNLLEVDLDEEAKIVPIALECAKALNEKN